VLIFNLCTLALLVFFTSLWNGLKTRSIYDSHHYIFADWDVSATEISLQAVISMYLLYNYLIPLDLAVILEVVAIFYAYWIINDAKMAHVNKVFGRIDHSKMNSLNLIENLGEVEYLMTDKTGTLTKNALTLVAASCASDTSFLHGQTTTFT